MPRHVRLDPDERQAIELFLRRRGRLGGARERELAAMLVPALADRLGAALLSRAEADPARALALVHHVAQGQKDSVEVARGPAALGVSAVLPPAPTTPRPRP